MAEIRNQKETCKWLITTLFPRKVHLYYIYQFGDHDPSGVLIPQTIKRRLNEFCEKFDCPAPLFERVALTEEQIEEFNLPTRPTKREGNKHANKFEGDSVELDAPPACTLRDMVRARS